jgi:transcriptional regulator with XRE-family HTH domain
LELARTREWREARGWTQQMLADEARVGKSTVVRVELGSSVNPRTAAKLAEALEVSIMDLQERPPTPLVDAPSSAKDLEEERRQELRDLAERFFETHDLLTEWTEFYIEAGDQKKLEEVADLADLAVFGAASYVDEEVDLDEDADVETAKLTARVLHAVARLSNLSERLGTGHHDELAGRRRKYRQVQRKHRRIVGGG